MSTYFLRTVHGAPAAGASERERLEASVRNTGNFFFEDAVARQLDDYRVLHDIEALPADAETLVLSMSNFISPSTDLGWLADLLERSAVPQVVMIGAGAQAESFAHRVELSEGTRRFIGLLSHRSASIGVRGHFTAEVLDRIGVRNVEVIGCPSLFYACDRGFRIDKPELGGRRPRTVAHCTPYGNYRDAVGHLLGFAVRECEAYIAQSETELLFDEEGAEERAYFFYYYNNGDRTDAELETWMRGHARWFFDMKSWLDYMAGMEFSVGSRFHGSMAALQAGVPALNLACDSRTRELCEYLNLPYRLLQDFDGRASAAELYESTDFALFNAGFARKYDRYRDFLERNGLRHRLGAAAAAEYDLVGRVRAESVAELLRSAAPQAVGRQLWQHELALRLADDRTQETMKLAENGQFDLRGRADAEPGA